MENQPRFNKEEAEAIYQQVERVLDLESETVIDANNETVIPNLPILWTL